MSCGHGSQRPTTLRLAISSSRIRACSKATTRSRYGRAWFVQRLCALRPTRAEWPGFDGVTPFPS